MEDITITEGIDTGEETLTTVHIEDSKCNCPECLSGRKHYIQILDMERYVEHLNEWD